MQTSFLKSFFIISIISLLVISCKSEKAQQMLRTIDQMEASVDSSKVVFKAIDTATISAYKQNAEDQLHYLKKFNTDTNYQNARYIDVYNSNFKLMRKLLKGYKRLGEEIEFSQGQLSHLENDISNGFAIDSSYYKYLEAEKLAVTKIKVTTRTLAEWETKTAKRYSGMVTPIDSIITELQNQGRR